MMQLATFGATKSDIGRAETLGAAAWVDEQLAKPREQTHVEWLRENGFYAQDFAFKREPANFTIWRAFLSRDDQLRQRMVYALSQILVVSIPGVRTTPWVPAGVANYLDILDKHAFGNFRDLLGEVTLSPAMGSYLSMRGSRKADVNTFRVPDQNYAREIMQLFTIGLTELNPDGTPKLVGGKSVDTYDSKDISGLASVFTGWESASGPDVAGDDAALKKAIMPMQNNSAFHEPGQKEFLGTTIPAGTSGPNSLHLALDALVAHPNVGPFLARQLIQRFVTANPSPAYVGRVARVFADNGTGVRGDLRAVLRALLLDIEALTPATAAGGGKLREPVLRFTQWARAFGVSSPSGKWNLPNLSDPATGLGQSPLQSSSVFNFYRPGYVPPGTALAKQALVSPEMQITTETSVAGYLNCMQTVIPGTNIKDSDLTVNYKSLVSLSTTALVSELNLVLAANRLGTTALSTIITALNEMQSATDDQKLKRVHAALLLVMACPEFLVLK
jgi:uncharacterized protein (DUF1800 family)